MTCLDSFAHRGCLSHSCQHNSSTLLRLFKRVKNGITKIHLMVATACIQHPANPSAVCNKLECVTCIIVYLYERGVPSYNSGEERERQRIQAAAHCCNLLASQHVSILRHSLGPWVTTSTLCTRFASTSWATALEPQRIFLLMIRSSAA